MPAVSVSEEVGSCAVCCWPDITIIVRSQLVLHLFESVTRLASTSSVKIRAFLSFMAFNLIMNECSIAQAMLDVGSYSFFNTSSCIVP